MTRSNVDIDVELVSEAMIRFGLPTEESAVELALRRLLASGIDAGFLRSIHGIGWDGDPDLVVQDGA